MGLLLPPLLPVELHRLCPPPRLLPRVMLILAIMRHMSSYFFYSFGSSNTALMWVKHCIAFVAKGSRATAISADLLSRAMARAGGSTRATATATGAGGDTPRPADPVIMARAQVRPAMCSCSSSSSYIASIVFALHLYLYTKRPHCMSTVWRCAAVSARLGSGGAACE